ncbi:MAG: hypothetical protein ACJ8AT_37120 [Hyalangium sp.]|uniref:hypothetical protein n=1 Tax=Hyalangium sp. TaxID=2028555 RepID=UPI00389B178B
MANRQRDAGLTGSSARRNEPPPFSSPLPKAPKTGARRALSANPELPWDAQEDAANLLADLPILPRVPSISGVAQSASVRPPPPMRDYDDEPSFTPSLRAPVDAPRPETKSRKALAPAPAKKPKPSRIADFVRTAFAERMYGSVRYRLHIGEPPGSKNKRKPREPLLLIPSQDQDPAIFCGWLDVSKKEAQIRSYSVMVLLHESRHGYEPDISQEEYERFTRKLMDTLFDGGIRLVLLVPDLQDHEPTNFNRVPAKRVSEPVAVTPAPSPRRLRPVLGVMFLFVLAFTLGMNAEHLFSWLGHALAWFGHDAPIWFAHALAWIRQAVPFLHS